MFVLLSGALGAIFVPGPILAVAGGLLFGPWLGIPLGMLGASVTALICRELGSHMGRDAAEEIAGARLGQITAWLDRYGLWAVIAFRLFPAMPDAPLNYAAGLTRLRRWQVGLGTFIAWCRAPSVGGSSARRPAAARSGSRRSAAASSSPLISRADWRRSSRRATSASRRAR